MTHTNTISPVSQPASGPPTVAGVMALIEADDSLAPGRRRDWLSALRGLCRLLDRPPDTLPAFMPTLADGLAQVNLVAAGMKEKRFSNIKSDVLAAFKHCGIGQARGAGYPPLSEAWQDLYDACDHRRRSGLSRFMHICSAWGISPGAVDDGIVDRFIEALPYLAFKTEKQVRDLHRYITRLWNECAVDIAAWPATTLSVPDHRKPRTRLELSHYPASFEKDVEAHLAWLSDADPFAERRPPRRYKPRTIKLRQQYILSAASLYVSSVGDPGDLRSLADLVLPDRVKGLMRQAHDASDTGFTAYHHGIMKAVMHIARYWVQVDDGQIAALQDIRKRMGSEPGGPTAKNRAFSRTVEDPEIEARLLFLPETLEAEAIKKGGDGKRAALKMQIALAIAILLNAPIRMGNLISLEIGRQLIRPGGPKSNCCLVLDASEVKNEVDVDFVLGASLTARIDRYIERFLPCLGGGAFLFPGQSGGHKTPSTLGAQIKTVIATHVGIDMTVHQFRRFAVQEMLSGDTPASLAEAQQLLAHKNLKTTINSYGHLTTRGAALKLDSMLAARREQLSEKPDARRKRRK